MMNSSPKLIESRIKDLDLYQIDDLDLLLLSIRDQSFGYRSLAFWDLVDT